MESAQRLIGRCIRFLREQRRLTLEQLASKAGITYQYLSGVETGKENFTISVLEGVATALGIPVEALIATAYREAEAQAAPQVDPRYFRPGVPLPKGLTREHIEVAANQTQLIVHRINRQLHLETGRYLQQYIQGNNFSGLVSNLFCDALEAVSPYKHNSFQRYPDLINPEANRGQGEGLEIKATINVGKGGEGHNGHGGWHAIVCYAIDDRGDVRFLHIMVACLQGHTSATPDWRYQKSVVNPATGSQRTETYATTLTGTTKLRDGSVYFDTSKVKFSRWRQARGDNAIPRWSIFHPQSSEQERT